VKRSAAASLAASGTQIITGSGAVTLAVARVSGAEAAVEPEEEEEEAVPDAPRPASGGAARAGRSGGRNVIELPLPRQWLLGPPIKASAACAVAAPAVAAYGVVINPTVAIAARSPAGQSDDEQLLWMELGLELELCET
jgi:hypothetical protein